MRRAFAAFTLAVAVAAGGTLAGLGLVGTQAEDGGVVAQAFVPQVACDDCHGVAQPSPTATVALTEMASPSATNTPSPKPSPTPSPSPGFSPAPASVTPVLPSPTLPPCDAADAHIVGVDKAKKTVTIGGHGNLTGWFIREESYFKRYYFKPGFVLNLTVDVVGGPFFPDTPTRVWAMDMIWNTNEPDPTILYDCFGLQRDFWTDTP